MIHLQRVQIWNKSLDYERTAEISTPSKKILPELEESDIKNFEYNANSVKQHISYQELAKNKVVSMTDKLRKISYDLSKVIVLISITKISHPLAKELVFDVPDTSSLKLDKNPKYDFGIKLPFQLSLQSSKETQFIILLLDVTFAQRLRSTLTYMFEISNGTEQEKLDFTVHLSCCKFIVGHFSYKDILMELLKSGQLISKIRKEVTISLDFDMVLNIICHKCNLTLVGQMDNISSLYGYSLKGHHVCLLLKYDRATGNLIIKGRGDNNLLLSRIGV